MVNPAPTLNEDREAIKSILGNIRDIYVDIIKLRNEDRNKYKEMCIRLDTLEKDRSLRTKKRKRTTKKKKAGASQQSKGPASSGAQRGSASKEDNKKENPSGGDGQKSVKNEEDAEKQE